MRRILMTPRRRAGLTIVEILVAISIASLLLVLAMPSVQQARESARRVRCSANLHEIGNAIHNYESLKSSLPFSQRLHFELLPYVDQAELHGEIAELLKTMRPSTDLASNRMVSLFHCPSDGSGFVRASSNYAGCGASISGPGPDGVFPMYGHLEPRRTQEVTDGLSQTVAISEILVSNGMKQRRRTMWELPPPRFDLPTQIGLLADACSSVPEHPPQLGWRGSELTGFLWGVSTSYNHVLPPNRPSCWNGPGSQSAYTSNSNHNGGVSVLMVDGHVEFISDAIDLSVWREFASIASTNR